ncbi:MAG: hydrogenase maturation protease [Gammaproteobacteria bacterium]
MLGVGNRYRRDDGAGSLLAEALEPRTSALVIDGGCAPENYLEKAARSDPDTVIIIDAVDFGGAPGDVRVLEPASVGPGRLSTHAPSLQMAATYLKTRTRARVTLLAIQPAEWTLGDELSEAVSQTVGALCRALPPMLDDSSKRDV